MSRWSHLFQPALYLLLGLPAVAASGHDSAPDSASATVPDITAIFVDQELQVDGYLDEEIWQTAPIAAGFSQRTPTEGAPISQHTEFRVAFTSTTLYLGFRANDTQPEKLVAKEMLRDGALYRDDGLVVLLDTFHDHRNAYLFETNPNGAKTDALITDEGRDRNFEWDGVWEVAVQRDDQGWTAEYAIPFSTLRFDPTLTTWGLNVRRLVRRDNEIAFWAPIGLDANVFRVSRFGHLNGLQAPKPGLNLQIKPFVTAGLNEQDGIDSEDAEVGLDVKWAVTRNLALDLTYNTDFAEVEADDLQVNLTRFSLFFPEKREFFLENSGIFTFGPGAPDLDLFFSRNIGIGPEGEQVPVSWGARLTGRVGGWNLGFLDAQTESLTSEVSGETIPTTNWGVLRLQRNLGDRSTVGVLATQKSPSGLDSHQTFGIDANLKPTDHLEITAFWASSQGGEVDESLDDQEWAGGAGIEWSNGIWDWELEYQEIRGDFNPEMGFLRRQGVRRYQGEFSFRPRSARERIRNFAWGLEVDTITRLDDSLESLEVEAHVFGISSEKGNRLNLFAEHLVEDLEEPFEIRSGIVIPAGRYEFENGVLAGSTDISRTFSVQGNLRAGSFFNGTRQSANATLRYRPNRHLSSETTWAINQIDLPAGDFETNLIRERLTYSFTPDLSLRGFVQYSDADELFALNVRFNWIYRPGADLFVVYNQTWNAPSLGDLALKDRQLIVKFTYLFDF
ncbi:MAG: carbohydrate binding family 9 domain-containing protein [Deltaproteobacteria bacterium]|nr:carbohydrate binding family 9 domain-containing protein [Deltaproteobacteria bacterium]